MKDRTLLLKAEDLNMRHIHTTELLCNQSKTVTIRKETLTITTMYIYYSEYPLSSRRTVSPNKPMRTPKYCMTSLDAECL